MTDEQVTILIAAFLHLEETVKNEGKKTRQLVMACHGLNHREFAARNPGQDMV